MQYIDSNLVFLKERINSIKYAIFKSEMNSELQLPNNVINTLQVDNEGNIWFFTSCAAAQAPNLSKSFYAYLDYYKKGTDCRLRVSGRATIIEDEDNNFLNISDYSKSTTGKLVLIKMKIMQAEYMENKHAASHLSWKEKLKDAFNHFFFAETHRVYDFN